MRVAASCLLLAACASTAPAPAPAIGNRAAAEIPGPKHLVCRSLSTGTRLDTAARMIWDLAIEGETATLVETVQESIDRGVTWTTTETKTRKGPVRHRHDRLELNVEGATDSMFLSCTQHPLVVAAAGARRVHQAGHEHDCDDTGTWSTAATTSVDALVCAPEDAGDESDLMTHWHFAAAPGIEYVDQLDDCLHGEGLRLAK